MIDLTGNIADDSRQHSIRAKCFHPSNTFIEFKKEEIEQSIPDRFEQMVRMYPDRLAVKTRSNQFTYDELNKAANRVAHAILSKRSESQEPVALLFGNNAPMIVAVLGVLKASKIYVPLDPSFPHARLASMLEDSEAELILTNSQNLSLGNELAPSTSQVVNIDGIDASLSDETIGFSIPPDALACILYTSGSTGEPKGVTQSHRTINHLVMRNTNSLHICTEDRQSLLSTYSHIAGVTDIFRALLNGACVFPFNLKEEGLVNLTDWLIKKEITIYHSVPSVFRYFINALSGEEEFPKLRLIHLGGEPVSKRDVELYKKHFSPDCLLLNNLGATELSGYRQYFINKETQIADNIAPAGYAANDTEVLLLNDSGKEVGTNNIGEIAVKSRYLSPGYWKRPDLTRAVFLHDSEDGDERIYRTGDLGFVRADGCLTHVGRKGSQVKVRGHRVEVAEIETTLLNLDNIKETVVIVREDRPGDKRLVAYIVPCQDQPLSLRELRKFLQEKLPGYMVPSAFVFLGSLPLTPTGKVDRRALPAPDRARPDLENTFVAPRTPAEEVLARVWAKVLGLERVGIHDNFLELGGHSLAATQVISRVIDIFRVELPVRSLLEASTIAGMAVFITENMAKKDGNEELAHMLTELESLSEEETQRCLADERAPRQ